MIRHLFVLSILVMSLSAGVMGCGQNSQVRANVLEWAKQITSIEKQEVSEGKAWEALANKLAVNPPTNADLQVLLASNNRVIGLYNQAVDLKPPKEAVSVHNEFLESYGNVVDIHRSFYTAMSQRDMSYYEKAMTAIREGDQLATKREVDFKELLDKFAIGCQEIDFCK